MRKLALTLASIALAQFSNWAQPVVTSANVDFNFTGEFYFAEATNFTPGPAGANQTWNFSNLQLTLAGTDTSVPVANSPFAGQFPTANYCYKFSGMFPPDRYYYNLVTSSKYELLSLATTATTGVNYTPNPRTFVTFPYTLNTVYNDTYRTTADPTDISVVVTYDAYGTLVLPTGTYPNVIRQKTVKNGTTTNYIWFNVQPFYPLLQTVLEENSLGIVKGTNLGIDENELGKKFAVYPNPTRDEINIEAIGQMENAVGIEMFDLLGKRLLNQKADTRNNDQVQLSLAAFNAGIYLLKITDQATNASHIQRIIKK